MSLVAQSEVYFVVSGKFRSMFGNWLSSDISPATSKMDKRNHA